MRIGMEHRNKHTGARIYAKVNHEYFQTAKSKNESPMLVYS